jgi:excisionase family DNA binding protein
MPLLDSYLRVPEAATLLGVHPETIKRLCQRGRIPAEKIHNTWLIPKEKFKEFSLTYKNPLKEDENKS